MDPPAAVGVIPPKFEVDADLGITLFFVLVMCLFLLVMIVRCAQLVLDPYSAISVSMYQDEDQTAD